MKTISYTRPATKALAKLPANVREDLVAKLHRYAETEAGKTKALVGEAGVRIRFGDYRIIFEETATEITVLKAGHRRDIYR